MFRRKRYYVVYTTQTGISDVLFSSEVIDISPTVWILTKNGSQGNVKFSLINWFLLDDNIFRRSLITYVTQNSISDFSFHTEVITDSPYLWVKNKNDSSSIRYTLINWSKLV